MKKEEVAVIVEAIRPALEGLPKNATYVLVLADAEGISVIAEGRANRLVILEAALEATKNQSPTSVGISTSQRGQG